MHSMHVQKTKEQDKQRFIQELRNLRVTQGRRGENLQDLEYYELRALLAITKAVAE